MRIFCDYNRSEEIVEQVYSNFPELKEYNIKIIFSDEFMQIHKEFKPNNKVPIDKFLGEYNHETKTIFIYLQGIKLVLSMWFDVEKFKLLLKMVVLYEIGNFWIFNHMGFNRDLIKSKVCYPIEISSFNYEKYGTLLPRYQFVFFWVSQMFAYYSFKKDIERRLMLDICNDYLMLEYKYFIFDVSDKQIADMKFLQLSDYKLFCKMLHINHFLESIVELDIIKLHSFSFDPNKIGIVNNFYISGFENRIVKLLDFFKNVKFDDTLENAECLIDSKMPYFTVFQKIINRIKE